MTSATTKPGTLLELEPRDVHELLQSRKARVVDVREADEHRREHIQGTVVHPRSTLDPSSLGSADAGLIVLHCRTGQRSAEAARILLAAGHGEIAHMKGGLEAWKAAGLPVVRDLQAPISIMRQVQIVIGGLVLVGCALGRLVSPWFYALPAFLGAGLLFAGLTGTCGLALLLGKLPWNRVENSSCSRSSCS